MKNFSKLFATFMFTLAFIACEPPETAQELLSSAPNSNAPYYFQFANASKNLETGVKYTSDAVPTLELVDIETTVDAVLLGPPLSEDTVIPFTVNSSSTIPSNEYSLASNEITIPAGSTSGSVVLKSVVENMIAGEDVKLVLDLDAGEKNATAGTQLSYTMTRIIFCPPISGTWILDGVDDFGDGWNDAAVSVNINDEITSYTLKDGASETFEIDVPSTTTKLKFEFVSGAWDEEVTFTLTDPNGDEVISAGPTPTAGDLGYAPCDWADEF